MNLYETHMNTPVGNLRLVADDTHLRGIYFPNHRPAPRMNAVKRDNLPVFTAAKHALNAYFEGKALPAGPLHLRWMGTPFQEHVWSVIAAIPHGEVMTYRDIAQRIGAPLASRAVGAATGRNPLSIIVPCHRVVGTTGAITGYAGGVHVKRWLLQHEGIEHIA